MDDGLMDLGRALKAFAKTAAAAIPLFLFTMGSHAQGTFNATLPDVAWFGTSKFFAASDPEHGLELWFSDGTDPGTGMVADIAPGPVGSNPHALTAVNGTLFFVADDGVHGHELWASDGTAQGTQLVSDIIPGPRGSLPGGLTALNALVVFSADDGMFGRQLWVSDGTAAHTRLLMQAAIPGGFSPRNLTYRNGVILFAANDGITGSELWRTDGTPEGTQLVADINSGIRGSSPNFLTVFRGLLYFTAEDGFSGPALWRSDGTQGGTALVTNLGGVTSMQISTQGGSLHLLTESPQAGEQHWISDGTAAGTVPVSTAQLASATVSWSPPPQAADGTPLSNMGGYRVYFGANPSRLIYSVNVPDPAVTSVTLPELLPGTLYFAATAYTYDGLESDFSAVVGATLAAPAL